jgi:superoxide reductase
MIRFDEKNDDTGAEKHVPVIERTPNGIKVTVGSVPHPMQNDHYIEWIEVIASDHISRKFLKPGEPPEAEFQITDSEITLREYCTIHGLWSA